MIAASLNTELDALFAGGDPPMTADEFRAAIASAIQAGTEQAGDAYAFSAHSDGHTYGTNRWRFVLAELELALGSVPGAQTLTSGGMKVSVVPVGGDRYLLVYPLCFANDSRTSPHYLKIRPSHLRRILLDPARITKNGLQLMLNFPGMDYVTEVADVSEDDLDAAEEDATAPHLEAAIGELPTPPRTLIAGYASNANGGLLKVFVGEASMATDGTLMFSWLEPLPLPTAIAGALYAVPGLDEVDRFDTPPEPDYDVVPHEDDEPGETPHD